MNRIITCFSLLIILLSLTNNCTGQDIFPELRGPYLGQKPPGMKPEIFAPEIISTNVTEGSVVFTRDNTMFLFSRRSEGILFMRQVNGRWTAPELASFSVGDIDWDFTLAPDDKTLFISSKRPDVIGGDLLSKYRIWKAERNGNNWSEPLLLPPPVNSGQHDSFASVTEDGTLYFFSDRVDGLGSADIYLSKKAGNDYPEVENLGSPINTSYRDFDAFIDPKEKYLIFCSNKPGGYGKTDLYISFRTDANNWSSPVNMGDKINSEDYEVIPYVTSDRKYFFFTSDRAGNGDIYWIDAKIIKTLRKKAGH